MPLFGKRPPAVAPGTNTLRLIPRRPGDTTPLAPAIAEALRKAGKDPEKLTVAPGGDPFTAALAGLPPAGGSLRHSFLFTDRADALRCVDTFADRGRPVTIWRGDEGWTIAIDGADDPAIDDAEEHRRVAAEIAALGGTDRGFARTTVTTHVRIT